MSTDSSGSSSDDQTQDDGGDQQQPSGSSDGSDDSTTPPKVQVTVNGGALQRAATQRYRKKYYRPYTPGDVSYLKHDPTYTNVRMRSVLTEIHFGMKLSFCTAASDL